MYICSTRSLAQDQEAFPNETSLYTKSAMNAYAPVLRLDADLLGCKKSWCKQSGLSLLTPTEHGTRNTGAPGQGQRLRRGTQDEAQVRRPRGLGAGAVENEEAGRLVPEGEQVQAREGAGGCNSVPC